MQKYTPISLPMQSSWEQAPPTLRAGIVLFFAHLLAAQAGFFFFLFAGNPPALIWPAAGVAFAGLVLGGVRLWPAVLLASLANSFITGVATPLVSAAIAVGITMQAVAGAYFLQYHDFNPRLSRLRDAALFLSAAFVSALIAPAFVVSTLLLENQTPLSDIFSTSEAWWVGSLFSIVIVGLFLIHWVLYPPQRKNFERVARVILSLLALSAISFLLSWTPFTEIANIPLVFLILFPLTWIALQIGPRTMTLGLLITSLIALTGLFFGANAAPPEMLDEHIVNIEVILLSLAFLFLILVSISEERKTITRKLEEHVQYLQKTLRHVSSDAQAKTEFLAVLAHELRNPLAPILTSIELMRMKPDADKKETEKLLARIEGRVHTISRLLDDLLDISRITRNKLKLRKEAVNVSDIIQSTINTMTPVFEERRHKIESHLPRKPLYLEADPVRIEQILTNLFSNAAKYTDAGGKITITCERDGNMCAISIRDTGIGIPNEMQPFIFEPFLQVSKEMRTNTGLGIGLSLTKQLIELHNGTIEVRSEGRHKGSEFIVRLPLFPANKLAGAREKQDNTTQIEETSGTHPRNDGSLRILVVDDNAAAAEGIGELLSLRGHTVWTAYDGTGALLSVAENNPDAILLDIGLPDMSGYDVIKTLREAGSNAKFIAITGFGQIEDKTKAQRAGFDYHLTKPIGIADIEAVLYDSASSVSEK